MAWLTGYQRVDLGKTGGSYDRADNPKLCWHTTEGGSLAGAESAFAPYPPHLGVDPDTGECHQYIDLDRCAYSLGHSDAEDSYVIQVEVVGRAAESHLWSPARLAWLGAHVAGPVADAVGVPPVVAPQGFHGEGEGMILASSSSPIRFTLAGWDGFAGHVGHQHCPGDDHWDPGRLDVAAILGATTEEDDMTPEQDQLLREVWNMLAGGSPAHDKPPSWLVDRLVNGTTEAAPTGFGSLQTLDSILRETYNKVCGLEDRMNEAGV
jgi:hypothetical protein